MNELTKRTVIIVASVILAGFDLISSFNQTEDEYRTSSGCQGPDAVGIACVKVPVADYRHQISPGDSVRSKQNE
ncbi:hypothetical protein [Pedobacter miscanthi]|uniref:hypothetical protein n=1 Tax=Pedobacter miscanthi TaxID=2259170 RepID=UPI00292FD1B1|nr:hypothetical protein [Pedobacter miscanthi]